MSSLTAWMIALTLSVCAIIITAAASLPFAHMAMSGIVSLVFALVAIRDHNTLTNGGASKSVIGSSTARHTGLVWAWGAIGILVTYTFILEDRWPEWWQFFLGFLVAAAASLMFASMLDRDATEGKVDKSVMKIGRTLVMVQFVAVMGALISMFIDGKFPRDMTHADWAGCNIFFFGGVAIAAISLNALLHSRES